MAVHRVPRRALRARPSRPRTSLIGEFVRFDPAGTIRELQSRNPGPLEACGDPGDPGGFTPRSALACPRVDWRGLDSLSRSGMVRRGSAVRVRKRALENACKQGTFSVPRPSDGRSAGTIRERWCSRDVPAVFPRGAGEPIGLPSTMRVVPSLTTS
jgi:hypothetical protein